MSRQIDKFKWKFEILKGFWGFQLELSKFNNFEEIFMKISQKMLKIL